MRKKEGMHSFFTRGRIKKFFCVMSCLLSLLLTVTPVLANRMLLSQKVTVKVQNADLKTVIKTIEEQTGLGFLYDEKEIIQVKGINLDVKEMEVEKVLDLVLKNTQLTYSISKDTILIKRREVTRTSVAEPEKWTIKGTVVDPKNGPLPGVSVYIKGTTIGVATNVNGEFALTVMKQEGLVLCFSCVGMKFKEVALKGDTPLRVILEEDVSDLDEVKVVAYGKSTKREMTGSVASVKGEDMLSVPSSNIATMLQGRVAGLDITNISGSPGSAGTATVLRGFNVLNSEQRNLSSPLWVIDGVPISNMTSNITGTSVLAELDPEMIESIEVLKDAAAAALYGSRAANGVILVTTKKGRDGQKEVRASVSYTYSYIPEYPTVFAGVEARRYRLKALANERSAYINSDTKSPVYPISYKDAYLMSQKYTGGSPSYDYWWGNGDAASAPATIRELQDSLNPFHNNSTNWFKQFFNTGKILNASVQAMYGTAKYNVSTGLGFYDEKGIVKNTGFKRFTFTTNVGFIPTDFFDVNASFAIAYARRKRDINESTGTKGSGEGLAKMSSKPFQTSPFLPAGGVVEQTLMETLDGVDEKNDDFSLRTSLMLGLNITSWLRLSSTNSFEYGISKRNTFYPSYLSSDKFNESQGEFMEQRTLMSENLLTFNKEFKERHKLEVLLGTSIEYHEEHSMEGSGRGGPSDKVHYVNSAYPSVYDWGWGVSALKGYYSDFTQATLVSYFGRVKYSFDQKYIFEATVRRDGSSKFGKAKPWGTFPSVSAGWVFSDEDFMDNFGFLDFGKLRGSWGQTGSQFSRPYLAYGLFTAGDSFMGGASVQPDGIAGMANPNLSWETTDQWNVGLDLDFFNYRVGVIFDYYDRLTKGVLMPVEVPSNISIMTNRFENAGSIRNAGFEFSIKYDVFRDREFRWRLNWNLARNWNSFEDSYNGRDLDNYIIGKPLNGLKLLKSLGIIQSEEQIYYKYTQDGSKVYLAPSNNVGQFYTMGDMLYLDANGDGEISIEKDAVYCGSPLPKVQGGILSEMRWRNFDLNLVFNYSLGRSIFNSGVASALTVSSTTLDSPILADVRDYTFWEQPGDETDFPRLAYEEGKNNFGTSTDQFLEKVNFLRLKSFVLGYTLPEKWMKKIHVQNARIYISGENLLTWTNYSGLDPESVDIMTGFDDNSTYPLSRKFTLGLTVNF